MGFKEIVSITEMDLAYRIDGRTRRFDPQSRCHDRFMRAYVRGMHRARIDRDGTIKTLAKYTTVTDAVILNRTTTFT
jgi:hypothetical protein